MELAFPPAKGSLPTEAQHDRRDHPLSHPTYQTPPPSSHGGSSAPVRAIGVAPSAPPSALTLVSASAGYGKTTLVSHWIDTLDRPTAWLSLDEQDDDLAVFLTYVTAALRTLFPAACQDTLALLNARSLPPLAVLVRRFSNDLRGPLWDQ
jgi:LuxR family transcriptional regulator, maltose regulon positive regulatory protein